MDFSWVHTQFSILYTKWPSPFKFYTQHLHFIGRELVMESKQNTALQLRRKSRGDSIFSFSQ